MRVYLSLKNVTNDLLYLAFFMFCHIKKEAVQIIQDLQSVLYYGKESLGLDEQHN